MQCPAMSFTVSHTNTLWNVSSSQMTAASFWQAATRNCCVFMISASLMQVSCTPLPPLSIYFIIFSPFYFSLYFIGFIYFLLSSIPSLSTNIYPDMTYNVFGGMISLTQSINQSYESSLFTEMFRFVHIEMVVRCPCYLKRAESLNETRCTTLQIGWKR